MLFTSFIDFLTVGANSMDIKDKQNNKDKQTNEQNKTENKECKDCLELKEKIIVLEKELKESNDKSLYLLADFDNFKKHMQKVFDENKECANEKMLKELLTISDDFDRAFEKIKDEDAKQGVLMIKENFTKLLNDFGVKKIEALGGIADPKLHEVLLTEKSDKEQGTILEELQKGYTYKNKILRYSKVKSAQ